jgi:hypothetical protein
LACLSARAGTVNALSPNFSDVSAAVASAGRGDTVQVPAGSGSANWGSSTLVITKGLFLKGPGRDQLSISGTAPGSSGLIAIVPDSTAISNEEIIRVEGFTFDGSLIAGDRAISVQGPGAGGPKPFRNLAIGNNKFFRVINTSTAIYMRGQNRGAVYGNIFDRCNIIIRPFGNDDPTEWANGVYPFAYGNSDNLFFEGNTIQWSQTGDSFSAPGWTENGQGGRIVIRYNTWDFTNAKDYLGNTTNLEAFDIHGFQNWPGNGQTGSMIEEIYGNKILNSPCGALVILRGSWGLVHNNIITGSNTNQIQAREYGTGATGGSGCADQIPGALGVYHPEINNTYCFNNTLQGNALNMLNSGLGNACGVVENTNFFNFTTSFNGSAGIGRGSSAPSMSGSNGVGYWVASTPTPTVDPNVVQNAHLWKWVGGNWVDYYHPYNYPHPLASAGSPAPPTALRVVP